MKTISLTQGYIALVDDEDFEAVNAHKWHVSKKGRRIYARRSVKTPDGKWITQYMHRFLIPDSSEVDHKDGNGLNNQRKSNIRPATRLQNCQSIRLKRLDATSKFRGVRWHVKDRKWHARISVNGESFYLGMFADEIKAARAYDVAARKYFGEFACPNFP